MHMPVKKRVKSRRINDGAIQPGKFAPFRRLLSGIQRSKSILLANEVKNSQISKRAPEYKFACAIEQTSSSPTKSRDGQKQTCLIALIARPGIFIHIGA